VFSFLFKKYATAESMVAVVGFASKYRKVLFPHQKT
jgi:hypothetical protein